MLKKVYDFFIMTDVEDGSFSPTTAGNIALLAVIILLFVAILSISGGKRKLKAKHLAFSAVAMTLAVITSIFTVYELPFWRLHNDVQDVFHLLYRLSVRY